MRVFVIKKFIGKFKKWCFYFFFLNKCREVIYVRRFFLFIFFVGWCDK